MGWDDNLKMIIMGDAEYIGIMISSKLYMAMIKLVGIAIQSGSLLVPKWTTTTESEEFSQCQHFDDMSFEETNAYGNAPPSSQGYTSEPMSITNPTPKQKEKDKRKTNTSNDAIHELATTIKDAFVLVRSSRSVRLTRDLQDECVKLTQYGYSIEQAVMVYEHLMATM